MQREQTFVARGNRTKGLCRTPHETPRPIRSRGVCGSCANKFSTWVRNGDYTDEQLVAAGLWLPKSHTLDEYAKDKLKVSA